MPPSPQCYFGTGSLGQQLHCSLGQARAVAPNTLREPSALAGDTRHTIAYSATIAEVTEHTSVSCSLAGQTWLWLFLQFLLQRPRLPQHLLPIIFLVDLFAPPFGCLLVSTRLLVDFSNSLFVFLLASTRLLFILFVLLLCLASRIVCVPLT